MWSQGTKAVKVMPRDRALASDLVLPDFCSYKKKQYFNKLKQLDILPLIHKFNYND